MSRLLLLNKPFDVLCQFTDELGRATLSAYIQEKGIYPAGRLDRDSEGLVLLTDDGRLQHCIAHPDAKLEKTYWVQVEGVPTEESLGKLRQGITLKDGPTRPAQVEAIDAPDIWPRNPPIRYRATIPTSWISLTISEGRNRQVRRMTAAVGYPTLRLIRAQIGNWAIDGLAPGKYREVAPEEVEQFKGTCPETRKRNKPKQRSIKGGNRRYKRAMRSGTTS